MAWIGTLNIILAMLLYALGVAMASKPRSSPWLHALAWSVSVIALLPWFLLLCIRTRWFFPWPFAFRVAPWSDYSFSSIGFSVGWVWGLLQCAWRRHAALGGALETSRWSFSAVAMGVFAAVSLPFLLFHKPLLGPVELSASRPRWRDGVCLQTTPSTCGPCAATTILRQLGTKTSEKDIARRAYTHRSGTRHWYLVRALRRMGYRVTYVLPKSPQEVAPPAILGIWLPDGAGHWISLLAKTPTHVVIGDPLVGRLRLTPAAFRRRYRWNHFAILIAPR